MYFDFAFVKHCRNHDIHTFLCSVVRVPRGRGLLRGGGTAPGGRRPPRPPRLQVRLPGRISLLPGGEPALVRHPHQRGGLRPRHRQHQRHLRPHSGQVLTSHNSAKPVRSEVALFGHGNFRVSYTSEFVALYLLSQWSFGRPAFTARPAADAAGRENTKPLQRPTET